MLSIGIGEIQKNIAILNSLNEAVKVIDKRRKKTVALIYPYKQTPSIMLLGGKYQQDVAPIVDLEKAKEEAMVSYLREKYALSH